MRIERGIQKSEDGLGAVAGSRSRRTRRAPDHIARRAGVRPTWSTRDRYGAVRLVAFDATSPGVPAATTHPPSSPAPGPMSITQSLAGDDPHLVLDDDHRIAGVDQAVELTQQLLDVRRVQTGRRLVEDV